MCSFFQARGAAIYATVKPFFILTLKYLERIIILGLTTRRKILGSDYMIGWIDFVNFCTIYFIKFGLASVEVFGQAVIFFSRPTGSDAFLRRGASVRHPSHLFFFILPLSQFFPRQPQFKFCQHQRPNASPLK